MKSTSVKYNESVFNYINFYDYDHNIIDNSLLHLNLYNNKCEFCYRIYLTNNDFKFDIYKINKLKQIINK